MKRRTFLQLGSLFPGLAWAGGPGPLHAAANRGSHTLILLELNGGNDGLNTVIPYTDPRYTALRPDIAIERDSVIQLNNRLGLHPALESLNPVWQANELAIVLGVGYPEPNRSHFRSIAIWETASGSRQVLTEGWVSQLLPRAESRFADGIVIGKNTGPLTGPDIRTLIMRNPKHFIRQAKRMQPSTIRNQNPALAHILKIQQQVARSATELETRMRSSGSLDIEFPKSRIGRQLHAVARILVSGIYVPVIKISHGSFDTHSHQKNRHRRLLEQMGTALAIFRKTLIQHRLWDQVLLMTYSEFGRRAQQNASRGTDHGTAAPHFIMGGKVKGGLYGKQPSLEQLSDGDLRHHVDYRSLYATIAHRWWRVPNVSLNRKQYPLINFL